MFTQIGSQARKIVLFLFSLYFLPLLILCAAVVASLQILQASDHIDKPKTIDGTVVDISDLYAFPSPDRPGNLTLILNVNPLVARDGHFSDEVTYSFLIRRASIKGTGLEAGFETKGDYRVSCTFETLDESEQRLTCTTSSGASARVEVDSTCGGESTRGLRVFAGRRSDPFFFNLKWATSASKGKLPDSTDSNTMEDMNVLSIVVDLDIAAEPGLEGSPLLAIAAETTLRADSTRRFDRVGRPEITNFSMVKHETSFFSCANPESSEDLRNRYNQEEPFKVWSANDTLYRKYRTRLRDNLAFYDSLDDSLDWTSDLDSVLVEILLDDFLVVDVSKPYSDNSYFEIEDSVLHGELNSTCGGRAPDDDVMDTLFTLLIQAGNEPKLRDGVDKPSRPTSYDPKTFPYLAAPDNRFRSAVKAWFLRLVV